MDKVGNKLIECKKNVKTYWEGADGLINLMRTGEVSAAIAWDFAGWKLNNEIPTINFLPPKSGALGWIDTFALPSPRPRRRRRLPVDQLRDEAGGRGEDRRARPAISRRPRAPTSSSTRS